MTSPWQLGRAALALLPLLAGCGSRGEAPRARLEASWTGSDTGQVAAAAAAGWCAEGRRLEIFAVRDDHGVGLALYPEAELAAGAYAAFDPGIDTAARPGVSAAARWYTDPAIVAYQSDSGGLSLTPDGAGFAGAFGFRLRSLGGEDTIRMSGSFRGLVPGGCEADSLPAAGDTE